MMLIHILFLSLLFFFCNALLEERFVAFGPSSGSIPIHDAAIAYSSDDPVGVTIAAKRLAGDLEQIMGRRPAVLIQGGANQTLARNTALTSVIIVGTANSTLMARLEKNGKVDLTDIRGKWETFKTTTVADPLPGIQHGLVIVGSDKRGAMFGIYTLSEQCGQSPYVLFRTLIALTLFFLVSIGGQMYLRPNMKSCMLCRKQPFMASPLSNTAVCSSMMKLRP